MLFENLNLEKVTNCSELPSSQSDVVWEARHITDLINDLLCFYTKNSDFKDVSGSSISDWQ